jgi:hypothetical protein
MTGSFDGPQLPLRAREFEVLVHVHWRVRDSSDGFSSHDALISLVNSAKRVACKQKLAAHLVATNKYLP